VTDHASAAGSGASNGSSADCKLRLTITVGARDAGHFYRIPGFSIPAGPNRNFNTRIYRLGVYAFSIIPFYILDSFTTYLNVYYRAIHCVVAAALLEIIISELAADWHNHAQLSLIRNNGDLLATCTRDTHHLPAVAEAFAL